MKKRIFLFIGLILVVGIGCQNKEETNVEKQVPVKIYQVKSEWISKYIRVTGSLTADEDVIVYSKIAERVIKLNVKPGQVVNKDQILVQQKNDFYEQGLKMADAALKTAESQSKLSAQDFVRYQKLFSEKAISQQQFDQVKSINEAAVNAVDQAKSAYQQAKEQYENTFVKAPFNGLVASVYVEENQMLNMGQPVVQIISHTGMKAKVNLTGEEIQQVKPGQKVSIKFPTIPGEEFKGSVKKINSSIDQLSKSLEVEIGILSNDNRLKSGLFGEFNIEILNHDKSIVVPETALLPQTEVIVDKETGLQKSVKKYYLFTVNNDKAQLKEVKTGITNNGQIEITDGINLGASIIIVGQNIVKEGQTVKVIQ